MNASASTALVAPADAQILGAENPEIAIALLLSKKEWIKLASAVDSKLCEDRQDGVHNDHLERVHEILRLSFADHDIPEDWIDPSSRTTLKAP